MTINACIYYLHREELIGMKNNKLRAILAILLVLVMLSGCGAVGISQERDEENCVKFSDMEYARPDPSVFAGDVNELESALADGAKFEEITELLDTCYADYYDFSTMYALAQIHYFSDLSNEDYQEEYSYCTQASAEIQQTVEQMYVDCANSDIAQELEEEYFWEGFAEEYGEGYESSYTDRAVELMQQESELLSDYYELQSEMQDALEEPNAYALIVYDDYSVPFTEIYISLVKVRRAMAEEMGYESYAEMCYENYERDYTPEQAEQYAQDVKEYIVPLCSEANEACSLWYYEMDEDRLVNALSAVTKSMGGEIDKAFEFMQHYELYDVAVSDDKAELSFTTYLDSYDSPYIMINPYGDTDDILTFAHEFGHFTDAYVNYNSIESLDLSEVFSQSMEYLAMERFDGVLYDDEAEMVKAIKLLSTLDTYQYQAAYAEFERRVYELSDEDLQTWKIRKIFSDVSLEYDCCDEDKADYYGTLWYQVTHFFESPFYVISYAVSVDASLQIYALEKENAGAGLDMYNNLLENRGSELIESLESVGLQSPFAEGSVQAAAELLSAELNEITAAGIAA